MKHISNDCIQGRIKEFDEHVGLGKIEFAKDGQNKELDFHSVAISDGTRKIDIGAKVKFVIRKHPLGGEQAFDIEKL